MPRSGTLEILCVTFAGKRKKKGRVNTVVRVDGLKPGVVVC